MESDRPIREILQQIAFECQESGATKWQVLKLIKELEKSEGTGPQLKKKAAELLESLNPEAAKTFLSFEKLKVYTSKETLEPFDRGNIIKSLLRETSISRHVAEKIGSEVEGKIKDLRLGHLNTQLIREMVNVKLLEYGHEPVHKEYARIGMPIFEVRSKLEAGRFENSEILREYNWLSAIPEKARELHFSGEIHVFCPEDFSTKVFSCSKFLTGSPEEKALEAEKIDGVLSRPLGIRAVNMPAGSSSTSKKKTIEECLRMEKIFMLTQKKRPAEIALFSDFEWQEFASRKKQGIKNANAFLSFASRAFDFHVCVDSKYQLKLLEKERLGRTIRIINNYRERASAHEIGVLTGSHFGILQAVGINMEKICENSLNREENAMQRLDEAMDSVKKLAERKKEEIAKRQYFEKWMTEETVPAICLAGLGKACETLGEENQSADVAERILARIQKEGFAALEMPQETALLRFGIKDDRARTQKMLLEMNSKQKKFYGFRYTATTFREVDALLNECPWIEFSQTREEHKAQ